MTYGDGGMACQTKYCFAHVPIFQNLQEEEFTQIAHMITRRTYRKGEYILLAGDERQTLCIIRSGRVKIVKPLMDGSEQLIRISQDGDFFGDAMLFQETPLAVNVEAMEPTEICVLDGEELKKLLAKTPTILFEMVAQLMSRIDAMATNLSEICHKEVGPRVASFLLKNYDKAETTHLLPKKDMASLLGTTRESVSRKLSEFQRAGYIEMDKNTIRLVNVIALSQIAQ